MAIESTLSFQLGAKAPAFNLFDTVSQKKLTLDELKSAKGTVIIFMCNHCPYVKHIEGPLVNLASTYKAQGISFVAISSNDIEKYPEDTPEKMSATAKKGGYSFPYLFDETQEVARAYHAACTPDFYLFDGGLSCVYRGRFDESTPGNNKPVTGRDLALALDALLKGEPIDENQKPSIGCGIKWRG